MDTPWGRGVRGAPGAVGPWGRGGPQEALAVPSGRGGPRRIPMSPATMADRFRCHTSRPVAQHDVSVPVFAGPSPRVTRDGTMSPAVARNCAIGPRLVVMSHGKSRDEPWQVSPRVRVGDRRPARHVSRPVAQHDVSARLSASSSPGVTRDGTMSPAVAHTCAVGPRLVAMSHGETRRPCHGLVRPCHGLPAVPRLAGCASEASGPRDPPASP